MIAYLLPVFSKRSLSTVALVILALFFCQPQVSAEGSLNVQKDAQDNIHVVIDPSIITKVQTSRQNGKISILVPHDQASSLHVDSVLKNAKVVDVTSSSQGKQIIIHTDAVYWDMKPTAGVRTLSPLKTATKPAKPIAKAHVAPVPKTLSTARLFIKPVTKTAPIAPRIAATKATVAKKPTVKPLSATLRLPPSSTVTAKATAKKLTLPKPTTEQAPTVSLAALKTAHPQQALLQEKPAKPVQVAVKKANATVPIQNDPPAMLTAITEPKTNLSKPEVSAVPTPQEDEGYQALPLTMPAEQSTQTEPAQTSNEEATPLQWENTNGKNNTSPLESLGITAIGSEPILRLTGGLLVVLALLLGFMKLVLPKLIDKGFFINRNGQPVPANTAEIIQTPRYTSGIQTTQNMDSASAISTMRRADDAVRTRTQHVGRYADIDLSQHSALLDDHFQSAGPIPTSHSAPPIQHAQPISPKHHYAQPPHTGRYNPPTERISDRNETDVQQKSRALAARSPQQSFIERLGVEAENFQVLNSSKLGKNKELHLVEIQGRQLLLATTPYSVSLVTELSSEQKVSGSQAKAFVEEAAKQTQSGQDVYKKYLSGENANTRQRTYQQYAQEKRYVDAEEVVVLEDYDDVFY